MIKKFVPCIFLRNVIAVAGFFDDTIISENPTALAMQYNDDGCDALIVFDLSDNDMQHDAAIDMIQDICSETDVPVTGAGNIKRMEDVKKLLYAGCKRAALNFAKQGNIDILEEVSQKFGKDRITVCYTLQDPVADNSALILQYASELILIDADMAQKPLLSELPNILCITEAGESFILQSLSEKGISGITGPAMNLLEDRMAEMKQHGKKSGLEMNVLNPSFDWSDFKYNNDGHVTVVVQDYRTNEVLMVAYMNEEAYRKTLETGRMTYYSRSRDELWIKGATSGHYQYVKSLTADCDMDTILAKVKQIGAACHTGSHSCFFNEIAAKEYHEKNPQKVLDKVYEVIADRKEHPKEGSYTNYLFDKGLDKILKKCGEEATEIVIAAKNPNSKEIVYEMSDYLYHMMVLMVEKGVSWNDITDELARR